MSNCHTCHWADRDPKTGVQVIHKEPDFLSPDIDPRTGNVPDVRIVQSCGRGVFYYKTYGARDHDCKKYEDAAKAQAAEAAEEEEKSKEWKTPTSRAKLPKTENSLQLIEDMAEKHTPAFDLLFDVMGLHFEKLVPLIKNLDDMNIRGKQIMLALDYSDGDIESLAHNAKVRSTGMIAYVNENYANVDKEKAVKRDASKYGHGPAKRIVQPKPRVMRLSKFKKIRAKHKGKIVVKPDPNV
jgi:hypothetical protein